MWNFECKVDVIYEKGNYCARAISSQWWLNKRKKLIFSVYVSHACNQTWEGTLWHHF
jgi:hypothetical protein